MIFEVWKYRYFILSSIQVDFRARFVRSRLGGLWMIINPLVQAAIFALILGQVLSGRLPGKTDDPLAYPIFLLSGTLGWNLFSEVIIRCLTVFIDNSNLLKKLVFPKICLPIIIAGSALVNNMLLLMAMLVIFLVLGFVPGVHLLWVPLLTLVNLAFALGIGVILGTLNVFIRDLGQVVPIVLQLGFWFTPIVYSPDILPETVKSLVQLNPMYWLIQGYQNSILFGILPPWLEIGYIALISIAIAGVAMFTFRRASSEIVDVL